MWKAAYVPANGPTKNNVERYTTEIIASEMQMLDSRNGGDAPGASTHAYTPQRQSAPSNKETPSNAVAAAPTGTPAAAMSGAGAGPAATPAQPSSAPAAAAPATAVATASTDFDDDIPF